MNETVNRKYILVISALAILVLVAGTLLKPKKVVPDPPSPSETASLQARIRRDELGQTASFFAQRAQMLAQHVFYDPEHNATGVIWDKNGQVLTTVAAGTESHDPPLAVGEGKEGNPPSARETPLNAGDWLLVVGRTAGGRPIWEPASYGGTRETTCAGEVHNELIVNARIDSALSGAGVFDLDGLLAGIVANCGGSFQLVSAASIPSLLKSFSAPDRRIDASYGFYVAELNDNAKRLFPFNSGLFVKQVKQGEAGDLAGLKAGDLIRAVSGQPLSNIAQLWNALDSQDENTRVLDVLRNRRTIAVRMSSVAEARRTGLADDSLGMRILPSTRVAESLYVAPGTPAYKAGLRTGDTLIQVGDNQSSGRADLSRAILSMEDKPLLIVYRRDRTQYAALVSK